MVAEGASATLGATVLAGAIAGAASGASSYAAEVGFSEPFTGQAKEWNWGDFGMSVGLGALGGAVGGAVSFRIFGPPKVPPLRTLWDPRAAWLSWKADPGIASRFGRVSAGTIALGRFVEEVAGGAIDELVQRLAGIGLGQGAGQVIPSVTFVMATARPTGSIPGTGPIMPASLITRSGTPIGFASGAVPWYES